MPGLSGKHMKRKHQVSRRTSYLSRTNSSKITIRHNSITENNTSMFTTGWYHILCSQRSSSYRHHLYYFIGTTCLFLLTPPVFLYWHHLLSFIGTTCFPLLTPPVFLYWHHLFSSIGTTCYPLSAPPVFLY